MKKRRGLLLTLLVVLAVTLTVGGFYLSKKMKPVAKKDDVPLARVQRGDLDLSVHANGELKARSEVTLSGPSIGGDSLQITQLLRAGQVVKKGDLIIEFDPSEQHYKLEQNHSELLQAEQEITKARADATVQAAQDKVALLKARFNVRRAELDVQKNELLSRIDADKNQLALQQAHRALSELEKDLESHKALGDATIYLSQEKANKARIIMDQAKQNLEKMQVVTPMDGVLSIMQNMNAAGGISFTGMSLPYYHAGDQVQSGSAIAKVVDPSSMELKCRVNEREHGNLKLGQTAEVVFDALPDRTFHATVKSLGSMSSRPFFESSSGGNFEVTLQLTTNDEQLRTGFTAQILFVGSSKQNVLMVPRQAVFMKDGKRVVFIKSANGYDQREVKVLNESESRVALEGVAEGNMVAMIDPTAPRKTNSTDAAGKGVTP